MKVLPVSLYYSSVLEPVFQTLMVPVRFPGSPVSGIACVSASPSLPALRGCWGTMQHADTWIQDATDRMAYLYLPAGVFWGLNRSLLSNLLEGSISLGPY